MTITQIERLLAAHRRIEAGREMRTHDAVFHAVALAWSGKDFQAASGRYLKGLQDREVSDG